jgi:molybdate transport system regulatory protein
VDVGAVPARADGARAPGLNAAAVSDPVSPPVRVSLRFELASGGRVGPGKIALLEAIAREGSIAGAARALGMSYPRAWALVEAVDAALGAPAVSRAPGGLRGGGAALTAVGAALIARYREVEAAAQHQAGPAPRVEGSAGRRRAR